MWGKSETVFIVCNRCTIESIFIVDASRNTRVMAASRPQRICHVEYTLENPDVIIETKVRFWCLINNFANLEFGKKRVPAGRRKRGNPVLNVSNFNVSKLRTDPGRTEFCTLFRQSWKTSLASAFHHKEIISRLKDPTTDHKFAPWALALFDMKDKQNPESLQQLHSFFHDILNLLHTPESSFSAFHAASNFLQILQHLNKLAPLKMEVDDFLRCCTARDKEGILMLPQYSPLESF